ncbi:hypothetical protein ACFR9U_06430 [Halorientalis brevis]|uniref:Uncharacterized protein n=1 Tax=Halorientalis brevis TaxID=1126241 RepID=A0ABD6C9L4_9EURY|nr:hypothetical protein [Halorientalis brevis]
MLGPLATTGGSFAVVVAAMVGRVVTVALALAIAYRACGGFCMNRRTPLSYLALGIVFLTVVPTLFGFVFPTLTDVSRLQQSVVTHASQLLGLGIILYSIYGNP